MAEPNSIDSNPPPLEHDHRRLGEALELFSISERVGPGLVLWHPKGALIREILEAFWRKEHRRAGYDLVATPHVGKAGLWERSGHLEHYRTGMFPPMRFDSMDYYVKPMNCPFHMEIFGSRRRSYRELPLRFAELGTVYRYEPSGVLHGLMRARGFTQDDAHIFCRPEQVEDEIVDALRLAIRFLDAFELSGPRLSLSTRPSESVGSDADWEGAEASLVRALQRLEMPFDRDEGGGAFYGPKVDVHVRDNAGREWQLSTVQFDFHLPERFNLGYIGADGGRHRPVVVHRALFGSLERFMGVLLEHFQGRLPLWLAPTQVVVLPVSESEHDYAGRIASRLRQEGVRAEIDLRGEPLAARIRDAELSKIPYQLVVGRREEASSTVSIRSRAAGPEGEETPDSFLARLREETGPAW